MYEEDEPRLPHKSRDDYENMHCKFICAQKLKLVLK